MANFYVTISPINTLSTSTYSIYYDSIAPSNLMLSSVPQNTLVGGLLVYFTGSAVSATSVIVKNEDPDCCCDAQSYTFPTPSPTTSPTTAAPTTAAPTVAPTTAAPTTAAPTTVAPTTAAPTTAAPTTAAPTTAAPTSLATKVFSNWQFVSGNNNWFGDSNAGAIYGWATGFSGTTIITGTLVITGGSDNVSVCAAPAGTSALVSVTCDLVPTTGTNYSFSASKSIAGGPSCHDQVVAPGTYTVTLRGVFGTNSSGQSVYIN
jgi:hypothetical protein